MDPATNNKSFNREVWKPQPLRTLAELSVCVTHRLLLDRLPAGRASSSMQIVVTVSQELAARLGAGYSPYPPTWMARLVGWMPSAIGHLQGGCAAHNHQILVTVSRVLTPQQGLGLNGAEVARMPDGREVGLPAGHA